MKKKQNLKNVWKMQECCYTQTIKVAYQLVFQSRQNLGIYLKLIPTPWNKNLTLSLRSKKDTVFSASIKAFTTGINVYGVFWAGGPWSQVTNSWIFTCICSRHLQRWLLQLLLLKCWTLTVVDVKHLFARVTWQFPWRRFQAVHLSLVGW